MDGRTDLHVFPRGTVNAEFCRDDILDAYAHPYAGAIGDVFLFQDNNARPHGASIVDDFLQQETILRMEWQAESSDFSPAEYFWVALGRHLAALNLPPQILAELNPLIALQKGKIVKLFSLYIFYFAY